MASRSKEALKARFDKKRKAKYPFSLKTIPSGTAMTNIMIFLAIAVGFVVLPMILPDLGKGIYRNAAISAIRGLELEDEVHPGQFKRTSHSGDTSPDFSAMFMAVSTLKSAGIKLKNEKAGIPEETNNYVLGRAAASFHHNTEEIYQGIVLMKSLGLFNEKLEPAEKYYNLLLSLSERHSGFHLSSDLASSIDATYFAFEAIEELGKLEQFKKTEEFNSAIRFVASLKDPQTRGFKNSKSSNQTILATWYAVQVLNKQDPSNPTVADAYEGVEHFVFACQAQDGGFLDSPVTRANRYFARSTSETTSQAIYILESLRSLNLISLSWSSSYGAAYYSAINYLRSCLTLSNGVVNEYPSSETDLPGTYYFLRLVDRFSITYGTPRGLQLLFVGIGLMSLLYAGFTYVRAQLPRSATNRLIAVLRRSGMFLSVGGLCLLFVPQLAVVAYILYAMYLAMRYYEVSSRDVSDVMILIAFCHTTCFMGMVLVLLAISPVAFAEVNILYLLTFWGGLGTFFVTVGACYYSEITRIGFYVNAGFLGWIANTVLFYSFLYGRGEVDVIYRMIVIHGHFPLVFIVLPLISLVLNYALAAYGAHVYFDYYDEDKEEKEESDDEESSGDEAD